MGFFNTGDPPMLTGFLQDKLGIKITRKKTTGHVKHHIISPKRKVSQMHNLIKHILFEL